MADPVPDPDSADVAFGEMRWNTPLSEEHAELLLQRLDEAAGADVLDLGCGWGELLLRAVARSSDGIGTGVDTADWALERGRRAASARALSDRVSFVAGDASGWSEPSDRVLCIGSAHAWGGGGEALKRLVQNVRPGGRLLFGDGYWAQPPEPAVREIFGDGLVALGQLVDQAISSGWDVLHLSSADQREWDAFESTWRAGRHRWLLAHPEDPRADKIRTMLESRLREYVTGYRGVLGFAYLVLARP